MRWPRFRTRPVHADRESRKLTLVQCSQCGTPVGVLDPATGPQIETMKKQIADIDERLNRIAKALQR
jgi:transcription initiation factor IIE alpha subunit